MFQIKDILRDLAKCDPYRPSRHKGVFLERASKLSWLLLTLSAVCFVGTLVALLLWRAAPYKLFQWIGLTFYALTTLLSVVSMLAEPIAGFMLMRRWKNETLASFCREIDHDEAHVKQLRRYPENTLQYAQQWLQNKVKRLDARIVFFFGGSAAVYTLLALTFSQVKDMGGLSWLGSTIERGIAPGNYLNTVALFSIALIFGVSMGVILMKVVQGRYAYHLELVELALKQKSLEEEKVAAGEV